MHIEKLDGGRIILIHDDCLHAMRAVKPNSIDMILADLPYGNTALHWDNPIRLDVLGKLFTTVSKTASIWLMFGVDMFTARLMCVFEQYYIQKYIWRKNKPHGITRAKYQPMQYYEEIVAFSLNRQYTYNPIAALRYGKGKACYKYEHYAGDSNHNTLEKIPKFYNPDYVLPGNVLDFPTVPNRSGRLHPTEKPQPLIEYLIMTYTTTGDTVLDPTFGSCTTGAACVKLNRKFIGIESDEHYFNIGVHRIENEVHERDKVLHSTRVSPNSEY